MADRKTNKDMTVKQALVIVVLSVIGLYFTGHFDPHPDQREASDGVFIYYGPEGETVPVADISSSERARAEKALEDAAYFGAYASDPAGQGASWTGAHTPELARSFALAACGDDCRIIAERLPAHRDPSRDEPVATTAMARNVAVKWPFSHDYIAIGGAGAWGHRPKAGGRTGRKRTMREAAKDCEARRAQEIAPNPSVSPRCTVQRITEFEDLRPKPDLYPAAFTLDEVALHPVTETRLIERPEAPSSGLFSPYTPPYLYGARAANGASAFEVARGAGWPEAGHAIALTKCNAARRPGEGPCVVTHSRVPDEDTPQGTLAVTRELYEAFIAWEETGGAGAFAISPYGPWGFSYDMPDREAAIQKAADWCWYYTRRSWEYRQVNRAFLDAEIACRIVAVRKS